MCGIAGFWQTKENSPRELEQIVRAMSETLAKRGPNDSGDWTDDKTGIALGHRRLSILDLTPRGHQPMESFCSRYVIAYNGEVYNFKEIRKELEEKGIQFKTECDTEVVLAAVSRWGIERALKSFNGMFAFALWDKEERKLFLARDRVGIKPLYYGAQNGVLYFSSELKAIRANKLFHAEVNRDAAATFFRYSYIPTPHSIYKDIQKLKQGCYLTIDKDLNVKEHCYWNALEETKKGALKSITASEKETICELEDLLTDAVGKRMIADVPLGVFLSGGIDSSLIAALMKTQSSLPIKTFTVGFNENNYDEAKYAARVAKHLKSEHTEVYVTPREIMEVIPHLPEIYDEPFSDSSQIPTFLISRITREAVTVSLSGDGGDETFGGYNRYLWADRTWKGTRMLPSFMRSGFASFIKNRSPEEWNKSAEKYSSLLPGVFGHRLFGDKIHKLADVLTLDSPDAVYSSLVSQWKKPDDLVLASKELKTVLQKKDAQSVVPNFVDRMMFFDLVTYLPDDILTKVDRASMAVSLETRVPFLDHRVIEFSKRLPLSMKIKNGRSKWMLREILYKHIPREFIDRPKMGFGVPLDEWLRGPLRNWAGDLLNGKKMKEEGFLDPNLVKKVWHEHLDGKRNWQHHLWSVLMFQTWKERWF